jgi:hypothetical protein
MNRDEEGRRVASGVHGGRMSVKLLFGLSGVSALVGASLIGYKGVAILATGDQPDHAFQIAPFFFGVSVLTLVYALMSDLRRPRWLLATFGWLAASAGTVAAIAHITGREDDFGDLGYLVNFVSTAVLLFLISRDIRRERLLGRWSFAPSLLAWILVFFIPVGAVLEGIDERLLEVSLLGVAFGWTMLGVGALITTRPPIQADSEHA